jgi:hypothetical protein
MRSSKCLWCVVVLLHLAALPLFGANRPKTRKPLATYTSVVPFDLPQGTQRADFRYAVRGGVCPAGHAVARPDNIYVCDHIEPNSFSGGSITFTVMTDTGAVLLTQTAAPGFQTFPVFCNAPSGTPPPPFIASGTRTIDISSLTATGDATLFLQTVVTDNGCGPGVQNVSLAPASVADYQGKVTFDGSFSVQEGDLQDVGAMLSNRVRAMALTSPAAETIHVPLGLPFKWGMVRKTTAPHTPIPCDFELSIFEQNPLPVDDQPTYPERTTVLFADRVLLPFGDASPVNTKEFVGIHLGTQYFKATPSDTSIPPVMIRVDVLPPTALGSPPYDVDDEIVEVANRRGIMPQWIKGQVKKEAQPLSSPFWDRRSFRYEPFTGDLREVSRYNNLRVQLPFSRYRLKTQSNDPPPSGLAQGISLDVPDDVLFRDALFINRGGLRRIVTSATPSVNDDDVTVREIVDANYGQRWWSLNSAAFQAAEAARRAGNDTLTFNAQTTLASSYGLLQEMYYNAIRISHWKDPYGPGLADVHPRFLTDEPTNLQAGDGSLHVATVHLLRKLDQASSGALQGRYGVAPFRIDKFDSFADFQSRWQIALRFYNYGMRGYATDVLNNANNYLPSRVDTGIQP